MERQRDAPWNDQHTHAPTQVLSEHQGLCVSLSSIPPQESPTHLMKTPLDAVLKTTSVQTQNFRADVFWECYFSTHFPQLSFLESC